MAKTIANLLRQGFGKMDMFNDVPSEASDEPMVPKLPSVPNINTKILTDLKSIVSILDSSDSAPDYVSQRLVHDSTKNALRQNSVDAVEHFNLSASALEKLKSLAERTFVRKEASDYKHSPEVKWIEVTKVCAVLSGPLLLFYMTYLSGENGWGIFWSVLFFGVPAGICFAWVYGRIAYQFKADKGNATMIAALRWDIERHESFQTFIEKLRTAFSTLTVRDFYQQDKVPHKQPISITPNYSPAEHFNLGAPKK